jgi:atypical dual specificity phosphatase
MSIEASSSVSFAFIGDSAVQAVLEDYYDQASKSLSVRSYLGAVVGCGAVAEGILTWALKRQEPLAQAASKARKVSSVPIEKWTLEVLLDVAREIDLITEDEQAIRDWRNLIHPYRRVQGSPRFDEALALSAFRAVARIVQAVGGSAPMGPIVASEMKFDWLIEEQLAGCRGPTCKDDLEFLRTNNIRAIVRLAELNKARVAKKQVLSAGFDDCHEPVKDFHAPAPNQITKILAFINAMRAQDKPVVVSCGAGYGRTGTVLACFLIQNGKSAQEALDRLEQVRPDSAKEIIEHPKHRQRDAIFEFERQHRAEIADRPPPGQ